MKRKISSTADALEQKEKRFKKPNCRIKWDAHKNLGCGSNSNVCFLKGLSLGLTRPAYVMSLLICDVAET